MIIFVRGLPGSGKSTEAKRLTESLADTDHIEEDMFWGPEYKFNSDHMALARDWCLMETARSLAQDRRAVVSNVFVNKNTFLPYLKLAVNFNVHVELYEMCGEYGSTHNVPQHSIERMVHNWEPIDVGILVKMYEKIKYKDLF